MGIIFFTKFSAFRCCLISNVFHRDRILFLKKINEEHQNTDPLNVFTIIMSLSKQISFGLALKYLFFVHLFILITTYRQIEVFRQTVLMF
jgi:hypothetical protein